MSGHIIIVSVSLAASAAVPAPGWFENGSLSYQFRQHAAAIVALIIGGFAARIA